MAQRRKVYLAGPDVFLPDAVEIGRRKKEMCSAYGFEGLFPFDNEAPNGAGRADDLIFAANMAMMRRADLGIFNLTPFRGPSADAGTVFELGLMTGLRKPVFGYTNTTSALVARVDGAVRLADGRWVDASGLSVEDFGNADNLMIDRCLAMSGAEAVRLDADGRLDDLRGFETCLRLAADRSSAYPGERVRAIG